MQSILIVEDDIYISDMVSNRIQQEGFLWDRGIARFSIAKA